MTFTGSFVITKRDQIQYNYFRMKRKLAGVAIMTFVVLSVLVSLIRYGQGVSVTNALISALIAGFTGSALMIGFNLVSVVVRVNRLYQKGEMSDFAVQYLIDRNGVHAKSERGDTDFAWKQILFVRETRRAFYLVAGKNRAAVIPKAQIENEGKLSTLRELFVKYIPANRPAQAA